MSECICGAPEPCDIRCEKHDRMLHGYPCGACEAEWRTSHPATSAAIARIASGKTANLTKARRDDLAAAPAQPGGDETVPTMEEADG